MLILETFPECYYLEVILLQTQEGFFLFWQDRRVKDYGYVSKDAFKIVKFPCLTFI